MGIALSISTEMAASFLTQVNYIYIYIWHDTKLPKDAVMPALGYNECSVKRAHWSWRLLLAGVEGAVIHVSA